MNAYVLQTKRALIALCLLAFMLTGAFGFANFISHTGHNAQVLNCMSLSMAGSIACKAGLPEIAGSAHLLFVNVLAGFLQTAYLLIACTLLLILFYQERRRSRVLWFRPALQEALSQGILNPKLF